MEKQGNVLVVDDDAFALRSIADILRGERYQVVTAASGSEALDLLKQGPFDLILTDLKMPEVDGIEVLKRAREIAPRAVVLILTGYASLESAIGALRKGAYDYLLKPCSPDELRLKIARGLEKVRLEERRQRAEEEIRQRTAQLEALRQVGLDLTAQLDLDTLLHSIVSQAMELVGGDSGGLYLYRPERDVLEWAMAVGPNLAPIGTTLQRGEGLSGTVWESGEPLIVDNYQQWERRAAVYEGYPFRATVGVPVRWGDEFLGVLDVLADPPLTFSPADAELLSLFATQAAIAIKNARLYESEQERRHIAETLRQASTVLSSTLELGQVLGLIMRQLRQVIPYDSASVQRLQDRRLEIVACQGFEKPDKVVGLIFPLDPKFPNYRVVTAKAPLAIEDIVQAYPHFQDEAKTYESGRIRSWLGVPLIMKDQVIGMIAVDRAEVRPYTAEDVQLAVTFANQAAMAVENAQLYQEAQQELAERKRAEEDLQRSYVRLQRALEGTVNVLVSAIEIRDPYTAGHQRRVTKLACAIAHEMGLPEEQIEGLRMAGLIHDIGKMNVPAEILSKPGPLNDLQYGLIKSHARSGYEVLDGTVDFPWPVAQIVLQHHERMDGSGYPQGLSGEEIMLEARILSVADVVEAMASHRPYREPLGLDKALEEITRNGGVLYDPQVVDVCLKLFTEKGFTFE
jgi:putative nucleotidyltransferase with HDIG domain